MRFLRYVCIAIVIFISFSGYLFERVIFGDPDMATMLAGGGALFGGILSFAAGEVRWTGRIAALCFLAALVGIGLEMQAHFQVYRPGNEPDWLQAGILTGALVFLVVSTPWSFRRRRR